MNDRLNLTGSQETDSEKINIDGYIQVLPRETEFSVPIRGLLTIHDSRNLTHDFSGSIIQMIIGVNPRIEIYTSGNLGEKLFYRFENFEKKWGKLLYHGIWCPITKETLPKTLYPFTPKISKKTSIEFILERNNEELLKNLNLLE